MRINRAIKLRINTSDVLKLVSIKSWLVHFELQLGMQAGRFLMNFTCLVTILTTGSSLRVRLISNEDKEVMMSLQFETGDSVTDCEGVSLQCLPEDTTGHDSFGSDDWYDEFDGRCFGRSLHGSEIL